MPTKVFDLATAEALILGTATVSCPKCGESNWTKAALTTQTRKPGMLTLRCKVCASKASSAYIKDRYANDLVYRESQKAASLARKKDRYANDLVYREAKKAKDSALNKERYANDPVYREAKKAKDLARYANDHAYREAQKARKNERYANDPVYREAQKARNKDLYANDLVYREAKKAKDSAWQKANPGKRNAYTAKRRAQELNATPRWVDPKEIDLIFVNCPPGYHVDHIYPLVGPKNKQGERIGCGFHAPINLQYLPASENLRKSNKWPVLTRPSKLWKFYTWKLDVDELLRW